MGCGKVLARLVKAKLGLELVFHLPHLKLSG